MLSDTDRAVLRIEDQRWRYAGRKDAAIMALGLNATQYAATLARLARDPDAEQAHPLLVKRIQRRLDAGRRARSASRGSVRA